MRGSQEKRKGSRGWEGRKANQKKPKPVEEGGVLLLGRVVEEVDEYQREKKFEKIKVVEGCYFDMGAFRLE
ncbi:MAG: hypothetical protein ACYCQK_11200 [Acidiferrobacteraceae bacterium]